MAKKKAAKKAALKSKPEGMSAADAAAAVLAKSKEPMTIGAILEAIDAKKLWTGGAANWRQSLSAAVQAECKKDAPRIKRAGRGLFAATKRS